MQGLTSYDDSDPESPPPPLPISIPKASSSLSSPSSSSKPDGQQRHRSNHEALHPTGSGSSRLAIRPPSRPTSPVVGGQLQPQPPSISVSVSSSANSSSGRKPRQIGIKVNRTSSSTVSLGNTLGSSSVGNDSKGCGTTTTTSSSAGPGTSIDFNFPTPRSGEPDPSTMSSSAAVEDDTLTDDQWFRKMTCPRGWTETGWADRPRSGADVEVRPWDVPEETDEEVDLVLQTKVNTYLRYKLDRGQHINTTLLSSTAFANPHIYSKLVEFVNIDERGTAFPHSGWLTRTGLEARRDVWGSKVLADIQKKEREALDKVQRESGSRGRIDFAPASGSNSTGIKGKSREKESSSSSSLGSKDYPLILPVTMQDVGLDSARSDSRRRERRVGEGKRKERDEAGGYGRDWDRDRERNGEKERERERKRDRWKVV